MSATEQSLSRKMAGGAIWMLSARMLMRASGLINVMVLARLLPPADFGVVGLTAALIGAFEAISDLSMTTAIVRHPDPKKKHYDTAFTIGFLRALLIAALALICAEPLAEFYGDERLRYVAWAMAAQSVIFGFTNMGVADFQRDFTFGKDFAYVAARKFGGSVASIAVALTIWPDYRALVAGLVMGAVVSVAASYILHPMRPGVSFAAFRELFGFSKWMLATNLLDFVQMPGFAKLQDNLAELRAQFASAYGASMVFALPFALGVALVAAPMIRLAFGPDWSAAAAPLQVLCFYGLFGASVQFCWPLLVSMGQPRRLAVLQVVSLVLGVPVIWWASVEHGLIGAAWAMSAMGGLFALLVMRSTLSLCGGSVDDVVTWAPRAVLAALAMALAVRSAQAALPYNGGAGDAAINLIASVIVGALVYPAALLLLWVLAGRPEGTETRILKMAGALMPFVRNKVA